MVKTKQKYALEVVKNIRQFNYGYAKHFRMLS